MAESVVLGGVTYTIPDPGESPNWATGLTPYLVAIAANVASNPAFMQYVTVAATPTSAISGKTYLITTASLAITMNLPTPAQNAWFIFKDVSNNAGSNNITIHRNGSEQIDGSAADKILARSGGTWILMCDGTNWWTINQFTHSGTDAGLVNADVAAGAALAYSKLALTGSIVNADLVAGTLTNAAINASAAIAYSKLNLALSILNADVSASAAIALSKLATVTINKVLGSDGSGLISATGIGYSGTKFTGLSAGTTAGDSIRYEQVNGFRVLQVVAKTTAASLSTTLTTFTASNLTQAITLSSSASKVLVLAMINVQPGGAVAGVATTIYRDTTNIGDATSGMAQFAATGSGAPSGVAPVTMIAFDSPAGVGPFTYTVRFRSTQAGTAVYCPPPTNNTAGPDIGFPTLILVEIG